MREKGCITLRRYAVLWRSYTGKATKELRLVRWDLGAPVYDLRQWDSSYGKEYPTVCGIRLSRDALIKLRDTLNAMDELSEAEPEKSGNKAAKNSGGTVKNE